MPYKLMNKKVILMILAVLFTVTSFTYIVIAGNVEPGSTEDPIVTQSYVELRNQQLRYYIDESIKKIQESINQLNTNKEGTGQTVGGFEVVNVTMGKKLIGGASTEMILRAGTAVVIDSELGGLADVTIGKDLKKGENIPLNHLLIIPRNDGRGAKAATDSVFMVKGSYTIE